MSREKTMQTIFQGIPGS